MNTLRNLGNVLVISPHLDDAVFSCGNFLSAHSESLVLTVFAGTPSDGRTLTEWDRRCGFSHGAEAMRVRREEDISALGALGVRHQHLDFLDDQYNEDGQSVIELERAVKQVIAMEQPGAVIFPLGLFHSDHQQVHAAVLNIRATIECAFWIAYEDALYRRMQGLLQQRLAILYCAGIVATPITFQDRLDAQVKGAAVGAYASQLLALRLRPGEGDLALPERYWRLEEANISGSGPWQD